MANSGCGSLSDAPKLKSFGSLLEFDLVNARKNADCLHLDRVALWLADKEYNQLILWLSPLQLVQAAGLGNCISQHISNNPHL